MADELTFHDIEGYVAYTHTPQCEDFKKDWRRVSSFLQQQTPFLKLDKTVQEDVLKRLLDAVRANASIRDFLLDFLFANVVPTELVPCKILPVDTLAFILETTLQHPKHRPFVQELLPVLFNTLLDTMDHYNLHSPNEDTLRSYMDVERGIGLYLGALLRQNNNKISRENLLALLTLLTPIRLNDVLETAGFDFQQLIGNVTAIDVILLYAEESGDGEYNVVPELTLTYFHEKGTPITEVGKNVIRTALRYAYTDDRVQWQRIATLLGVETSPSLVIPQPQDNLTSPPRTPVANGEDYENLTSPPATPPVQRSLPVPPPLIRPSGTLGADSPQTASPVARTLAMPPIIPPKDVVYTEEPMCYHIVEMEDMSVLQAICQGDVVFKLGNSYIATDKKNLDRDVEDRTTIRFKCNRELAGAPRMRDVDGTEYYLLQLTGNVLVDRQDFGNSLWTAYNVFELNDSGTTFPYTASATSVLADGSYDRSVVGTEVNIVSADHCQAGSDRKLYTIVPIILKRGQAGTGGKKPRKTRRGKKVSRRRGRR